MPNPHGSFIWYELMTSDAAAAGEFYSAVVGWTFGDRMPGDIDYRGIVRSDGGNAGGVLQIDESMRSHGARPGWLGYIGVDDVDATVAAIEGDGGKVLMPAWDLPNVGRLAMVADPQGAPFYLMRGASEAIQRRLLRASRSTSAGTSWRRPIPTPRSPSTPATSAGGRKATWTWGSWANTASSTRART